jgi:hypothetical protein
MGNGGEGMKKKIAAIAALAVVAVVACAAVWVLARTEPQIEESELPKEYPSSTVKAYLKYALVGDYERAGKYVYNLKGNPDILHYFDNYIGKGVEIKIDHEGIKAPYATVVVRFYQDNKQISEVMCVLIQSDSKWLIVNFNYIPEPFW